MNDLPPRTWHGWWLAWPKWFRIGCWAGLGMVLLHLVLAVRIYVGLQEPAEIKALRQRDVLLSYDSDRRGEPVLLPGFNQLLDGLKGRSCADVVWIRLNQDATDADLHYVSQNFCNLESLTIPGGEITADGLANLERCPRLFELNLSETDIDDAVLSTLDRLQTLSQLKLNGTLVTDAVIPQLKQLPNLEKVYLSFTDVSLEAILEWRMSMPGNKCWIGTDKEPNADAVLGSIRWNDGHRSGNFSGTNSRVIKRGDSVTIETTDRIHRSHLWWPPIVWSQGDGEYEMTLILSGYESEPVTVLIQNGTPSTHSIEFRMPCTKAEALAAVKND